MKWDACFEEKIDQWMDAHQDQMLEDLRQLVAIPSVSQAQEGQHPFGEGCANVLDHALELSEKHGFLTENYDYYCGSCRMQGQGEKRKLIGLFSHLDVVPVGDTSKWTYGPWNCTQQGDFLVGRGVGDNKGPAMAAFYALRFFQEEKIPLQNDVLLYFGCSEETGMADIQYFCEHGPIPDFSLVPDNDFPVCFGEKGIFRFTAAAPAQGNLLNFTAGQVVNVVPDLAQAVISGISAVQMRPFCEEGIDLEETAEGLKVTAHGLSRHAAFPEGSCNAVHLLADALARSGLLTGSCRGAVEGLAHFTSNYYGETTGIPFQDEASGRLTCVGSVVRLEDGCLRVRFDTRYPVTVQGEQVKTSLRAYLESKGYQLEDFGDDPPAYVPKDHPAIPLLCEISDHVLGRHLEPYTTGGGTYARHLPNAVGFGPGIKDMPVPFPDGKGHGHQPDECISIQVLRYCLKACILALIALDNIL